jgi:GNAT superfamily N-acetyltransferase
MTPPQLTITLEPIDLANEWEFRELQRQRELCGWDYDTENIEKWRQKQNDGLKSLFWIVLVGDPLTTSPTVSTSRPVRAGHISLDSYSDPPDPDLARADKTVMTIQSFFVLHEYRHYGIGHRALETVEAMATKEPYGSPQCKYIAVNTLHKRYVFEDGPDAGGVWQFLDLVKPLFSVEEWYERLGYVRWKAEPRYPYTTKDGRQIFMTAAFLRKSL